MAEVATGVAMKVVEATKKPTEEESETTDVSSLAEAAPTTKVSVDKAQTTKASSLVGKLETEVEIKTSAETTKASSLVGKLETEVEIKASAEKFHHMFAGKPHQVPKASPGKIQGCDLHEGDWGIPGSIVYWNYVHDGVAKVAKERIEAVEPEKNLITFRVIEGDLMTEYKSFVITIQVTPKQGGPGSIVHWHLEYEKISDEVAHPETLLQFCVEVSKEIDDHLLAAEE